MRRLTAFLGLVAVLVLALMLLWQVYQHHEEDDPYDREATVVARVKIAPPSS